MDLGLPRGYRKLENNKILKVGSCKNKFMKMPTQPYVVRVPFMKHKKDLWANRDQAHGTGSTRYISTLQGRCHRKYLNCHLFLLFVETKKRDVCPGTKNKSNPK